MSKIEFTLDGKLVTAEPDQTILQVARANGIDIPSLCYNDKISKTTSCFVCVVRDAKTGKFLPSCAARPAPGQVIEASSDAVKEMRKTAFELLLSEHTGDCEAPCTLACPAHANVEEYVRAGKNGEFMEALKIIKKRIPLPMSIGRVCPRFCEKDCRKNIFGQAVSINDFKRLAADLCYSEYLEETEADKPYKVAIVGAGPAGLAAAYYLRMAGVKSVIFDQMEAAGGMLRYGIPEYRLPKHAVLDKEIAHYTRLGIKFEFGKKLGENLDLAELEKEYDAVVLALGCWKAGSMRCEGDELSIQGIDYLRDISKADYKWANPGKVIVVGGGNTAMDCLRTSVRLGSPEVTCFYRRTEAEMPAEKLEIAEAREEGVKFEFLVAPVRVSVGSDGRKVLTCQRMALGEPDASGRRRPVPVPGSEFDTVADTIIAAIGQSAMMPAGIPVNKYGYPEVDADNMQLGGKVFAAGDCVSGAATVVEAVAGGRRAALGVLGMLTGVKYRPEPQVNVSRGHWASMTEKDLVFVSDKVSNSPRAKLPMIGLEERKTTFKEVAGTMSVETIRHEGERCIECSCTDKTDCRLRSQSAKCGASPCAIKGGKLAVSYDTRHPLIIQDRGKCIKCGTCVKVCKEVINKSLLSAKRRGFSTYVGTAFDNGLPLSCADCLACVTECPTGALDLKNK